MRIMYAETKWRLFCCGKCDANGPETSDAKLMNISIVPMDVKTNNAKNPRYIGTTITVCTNVVRTATRKRTHSKPVPVSFVLCCIKLIELTPHQSICVCVCTFSLASVSLDFSTSCFAFHSFNCLQTTLHLLFVSFCIVTSILCIELCIFYRMQFRIQFHIPCINSEFKYNNCSISNKKNVKNSRCSRISFSLFSEKKKRKTGVSCVVWAQKFKKLPHAINYHKNPNDINVYLCMCMHTECTSSSISPMCSSTVFLSSFYHGACVHCLILQRSHIATSNINTNKNNMAGNKYATDIGYGSHKS